MTQDRALDILKTGANVFLTGEPGAGKTHVINHYTAWLHAAGIPVAITASTGIAATHIGGLTIHSWSGVGTRDELTPRDIDAITSKEYVVKRMQKTKVLIIDEISMLDAHVLDMVDRILRAARGQSEPFGGVQLVCVGDFFQLPPIMRNNEPVRYAFSAKAWQAATPIVCYLSDQHRHEDDLLRGLLSAIRTNTVDETHYSLLEEQQDIGYEDVEPTRLFTHNAAVDSLNYEQLKALPASKKAYRMQRKGNKLLTDGLARSCLSPEALTICEDAMVMCTKNNFEAGYANGTLGRVVGFEVDTKMPRIETADGREIVVKPATWSIMDHGKPIAEITQVPLRLAWAITVHKSQGMSLDAVEMDLQNAFVYGQGYVALSRVRTLTGLKVLGLNPNALQVDPLIVERDTDFKSMSEQTDAEFAAMEEDDIYALHKDFVTAHGKQMPGKVAPGELPKKPTPKSTYEQTREALEQTPDIEAVAKQRGLTSTTIISHIEQLCETGAYPRSAVASLLPAKPDWSKARAELFPIMEAQGIEKLRPIYDAANGAYDYPYLRLARLLYQDEQGSGG